MNTTQSTTFSKASCHRKSRAKKIPIGKIFNTNYGQCVVLEYRCATHITVRFLNTESVVVCRAEALRKGHVKDPLCPSVCGIGFTAGEMTVDSDGTRLVAYDRWQALLQRVRTRPEYVGVDLPPLAVPLI